MEAIRSVHWTIFSAYFIPVDPAGLLGVCGDTLSCSLLILLVQPTFLHGALDGPNPWAEMVVGIKSKTTRGRCFILLPMKSVSSLERLTGRLSDLSLYLKASQGRNTGSSKINGAMLSDTCSVRANWLCMGWPFCLAEMRREFQTGGNYFCTTLYASLNVTILN